MFFPPPATLLLSTLTTTDKHHPILQPNNYLRNSHAKDDHIISSIKCPSNETHIGWPNEKDGDCHYQTVEEALLDASRYLQKNMMPFDVPNAGSLGFPPSSSSSTTSKQRRIIEEEENVHLPDGLSDGIVNQTIHLALSCKQKYRWTDSIPKSIYQEYVLNYACVNEPRTNWRPLFSSALEPILNDLISNSTTTTTVTVEDVVRTINQKIWLALSLHYDHQNKQQQQKRAIYFKSGQTPLIYDPMSIIAYGYGSCTGLSIFFVFALRASGIPARLVGTPAWNGDPEKGNHNWVEVYHDGKWGFVEPAYGDFGETVDDLKKDPCKRWFCKKDRFDGTTKVFAARLDRDDVGRSVYPMAWDLENEDVPGEDRTDYYTDICSKC